jgi:gliding motility-associated-like protein
VRLSAIPGVGKIELAWRDSVPWSNVVPTKPRHLIYRGVDENSLLLFDSVDVSEEGQVYVDNSVNNTSFYFYRIKTRGSYGNPAIKIQENYSQIVSLYPTNNFVVCAPIVSIVKTDCSLFQQTAPCGQKVYSNSLSWTPVLSNGCRIDISGYNIYAQDDNGDFQKIASNVLTTFFEENDLPSFARCYRVSAVDSRGQEGALSEIVCNDNCPYFELPNIFTPNQDGCNDFFSTVSGTEVLASCNSGTTSSIACSRFIRAVTFKVYNRWGKEVYSFQSGDGKPTSIDWNGRGLNGNLLDPATYYYVADVSFDVRDPAVQTKRVKGWINLTY